jgi:hypothetical protein
VVCKSIHYIRANAVAVGGGGITQVFSTYMYIIFISFQCFTSDERIDIEKLKVKEQILYYADVLLFEDELADNGSSMLNVKMVRSIIVR